MTRSEKNPSPSPEIVDGVRTALAAGPATARTIGERCGIDPHVALRVLNELYVRGEAKHVQPGGKGAPLLFAAA
ncbi:MAG TPA: hypothetical protein VD838_01405 [Anaeromyxobacteraceae bacterium]|nr:hypothetical protein [Anaeromyxobacteraceae bacterium]